MTKRLALLTGTVCLILGFQNCSQNSLQTSEMASLNDVSVALPPSGGGDSANTPAKVTYVEIPNVSDTVVEGVAAKASELGQYRLVIATDSGRIQLVDEVNTVIQERCLSAGSLSELKTILSGSSVCAAPVKSADMCAMRYKPAYASLYANETRVNLGEEKDSCGTGLKDLCGGLADVFQAYVSHVRNNWTAMNCE
ncbi:hypothetical protein [Bdellovibrio bacteriovorus]|uniref:Uncharacterized protein n=1 Tax=Bdellovibrio bacteriovorus str. Tiberius TaxID=1069642 RepID=K7YKF1_BDEBC|nr:hypothetical protein [Bdellovibrio bacteriovorus]AFY00196.1 hypothetical protein Bdt_0488 [Bdellovibrio bacteriovorus str. Tiberius]